MKIRSLLLGSLAAAGLSTGGAYAADLGVLTSLDICDSLGLSGLTISSDTNCLQITGEVKYKFAWGDDSSSISYVDTYAGDETLDADDGAPDWTSRFDAWIKFVATAESDFGPAKAVIKIKRVDQKDYNGYTFTQASSQGVSVTATGTAPIVVSEGSATATAIGVTLASGTVSSASFSGTAASYGSGSSTDGVIFDEAYVSIGDSTVIMAGKKGSILNDGDDEPLNWLGLFNSDEVGTGVAASVDIDDGGHVIQVTSDLGNGFSVKAGLENLEGSDYSGSYYENVGTEEDPIYEIQSSDNPAGTFIGVLEYAGDGISAHVSFAADGILAMDVQDWMVHAGFAGTFDNFKVVLAGAFDSDEYWNVLASASATFDMFTIAAGVEAAAASGYDADIGVGASISAAVTDTVTLNLGGRWYHDAYNGGIDSYEVAAQVEAAVTETITVTGKVGYLYTEESMTTGLEEDVIYGSGKLAWAPGGGFTSSLEGKINSNGAYTVTSEFKKTFE
jgi:hypothetical protein